MNTNGKLRPVRLADLAEHPAAALFPMMPDRELRDLARDIRDAGVISPIVVLGKQILDGRNRAAALKINGDDTAMVLDHDGTDPVAYVVSQNIHRRHLTVSQRAMVGAGLETLRHGDNQHSTAGDANSHVLTRAEIAEQLQVAPRTIADASKVAEQAPDLAEAVRAGEMTVNAATREIAERKAASDPTIAEHNARADRMRRAHLAAMSALEATAEMSDTDLLELLAALEAEIARRK